MCAPIKETRFASLPAYIALADEAARRKCTLALLGSRRSLVQFGIDYTSAPVTKPESVRRLGLTMRVLAHS